MLVLCNGAFKSGSTWIYQIVSLIIPGKPIPHAYHSSEKWHGKTIVEDKLSEFLENVDFKNEDYVCKAHYDNEKTRDILLKASDVYILNIKRDLRDVITSAYYHFNREDRVESTFDEFYWEKGRNLIGFIKKYHDIWHPITGKIYVSSYQLLHEEFENEVNRIFNFLNYILKPGDVDRLKKKTTMEISQKLWNEDNKPAEERFFRKGVMGDWRNHFTPEIEEDFINTLKQLEYRDRIVAENNKTLFGTEYNLSRKDPLMKNKDETQNQKDMIIAEKNQEILRKENEVKEKLMMIAELRALVNQKEKELKEKNLQLQNKNMDLSRVNRRIEQILNSRTYSIGKIIITPAVVLKKLISRQRNDVKKSPSINETSANETRKRD